MAGVVLAIDPGRQKCGFALVSFVPGTGSKRCVLEKGIVDRSFIPAVVEKAVLAYPGLHVLIGSGTGSAAVIVSCRQIFPDLEVVDEGWTTSRARKRYLLENPSRGWRRLIPCFLRTPTCPVDDYAALILAEDWIEERMRTDLIPGPSLEGKGD
jgi:RNase H-fold protein (predicted Holliday junction resolvase)